MIRTDQQAKAQRNLESSMSLGRLGDEKNEMMSSLLYIFGSENKHPISVSTLRPDMLKVLLGSEH